MKKVLMAAVLLAVCGGAVNAKETKEKVSYTVTNTSGEARVDEPVVITDVPAWAKSVTVTVGGKEIPSQLDDLNGDGVFDEAAFVVDLAGGQSREAKLLFSDKPAAADRYPARVHSQMWWKGENGLEFKTMLESDKDDMYNKLHHHGPAFESELAAYRVYFDKKQSIDLYGKKKKQLELAETMWYTTDEQLAAGYGHDNIRVFGSISVGVLKGWDSATRQAVHIEPMTRREARLVTSGPVRVIVDMRVEGWQYMGKTINMTSRYILYAGHRDVKVENTIEGDSKGLVFCTGVMKMAEHESHVDRKGNAAVWGTDYPENDYQKWEKETCGIAVSLPDVSNMIFQTNDKLNYLYVLAPDSRGRIDYWLTTAWKKETFSDWTGAQSFFDYADKWAEELKRPTLVSRK